MFVLIIINKMKIIDGKKIGEKIKDSIAKEVFDLIKKNERRPNLSIILAGDRSDSRLYVSLKEKSAKGVGIDTNLYLIDETDGQENLIKTIEFLNNDKSVDGILIQLPLPKKFNTEEVLKKINPTKDVDGFCFDRPKEILSPVLMAIKESLDCVNNSFKKESAFLFYNSEIFKEEVKNFLEKSNIKIDSICSEEFNKIKNNQSDLDKIKNRVKSCDILITAVGNPHFINKDFLKNKMIIIDIGITTKDKKVFGDVDLSETENLDLIATPVPGGIGPVTVACVLKNTLTVYKLKNKL
ncbi:MAG TPA: bifunctional 5,10-methylenetetrahydrofolate dehydrogenase/5,10-methenyltetrahydrofolate cyclohydrolase [bacterium]|nr:bifunctional 5,10-methylenetetrahydrofolate dehydrogenase/5,10-methenyltetrahydrofolate cyclohydrolase [bacterium]